MTSSEFFNVLEVIFFLYLLGGAVFCVPFYRHGLHQLGPSAQTGSLGFRVFIFPGVVFFWPLMVFRRTGLLEVGMEESLTLTRKNQALRAILFAAFGLFVLLTAVLARPNRTDPPPPPHVLGD